MTFDWNCIENDLQRDELEVLSSIYQEELRIIEQHPTGTIFEIKFPINGPTSVFLNVEEISEIVRFDSSNNERGNESLRDSVENIRHSAERKQMLEVAFLPPMSLRVSLNPEYLIDPHSYPTPTVIAPWLTCVQRSGLEKRLIGISKDPTYHGLPMVSIWVSWLQENSFDFLALMFETAKVLNLPLGERLPFSFFEEDLDPTMKGDILYVPIFDQDENEDEKNQLGMEPNGSSSSCVSGFATSQHKMRDLIRRQNERVRIIFVENEQQKEIDFKNGTHTCQVCLEEHPGHKFPIENQSLSCKHKTACLECLNGLCRSMILNGNVMEIRCTERGCKGELPIVLVQKICPDLFEKYELYMTNRMLERTNLVFCPQPSCKYTVQLDEKVDTLQCPACNFTFCTTCLSAYHPSRKCLGSPFAPERLKIKDSEGFKIAYFHLQSQIRWMSSHCDTFNSKDEIQAALSRISELISRELNLITTFIPACPKCRAPIERIDGCNKMTCSICATIFCWLCLEPVEGYSHFSPSTCSLFSNTSNFERELLTSVDVHRVAVAQLLKCKKNRVQLDEAIRICPSCTGIFFKDNENNIFCCPNCGATFCLDCGSCFANILEHYMLESSSCKRTSLITAIKF